MQKSFPGKAILFGEYSIIAGSEALIVPVHSYSGHFSLPVKTGPSSGEPPLPSGMEKAGESSGELKKFLAYLSGRERGLIREHFDLEKFREDLASGLYFDSDIPQGYGLGSSAALVAAVFDRYASDNLKSTVGTGAGLITLREVFSRMESYYHGQSSGIDPLCSFTSRPVHVRASGIQQISLPALPHPCRFLLLDSGTTGATGPLVTGFRKRMEKDPDYAYLVTEKLSPLVNSCIGLTGKGDTARLPGKIRELSELQFRIFREMIPDGFLAVWTGLLEKEIAVPKLCGSGGGGFFLLFSEDPEAMERIRELTPNTILPLGIGSS
jgi:mevalonate kinase